MQYVWRAIPFLQGICQRQTTTEQKLPTLQVVISSAFETDLGLSQYAHLAAAIESCQPPGQAVYHGLGTSSWLGKDTSTASINIQCRVSPTGALYCFGGMIQRAKSSSPFLYRLIPRPSDSSCQYHVIFSGYWNLWAHSLALSSPLGLLAGREELVAAIDVAAAHQLLSSSPLDGSAAANLSSPRLSCAERNATIETSAGVYSFRILHWSSGDARTEKQQPVFFLHGFLGEADDWTPIAAALSLERDCYAVDLPGHGGSAFKAAAGATGRVLTACKKTCWHALCFWLLNNGCEERPQCPVKQSM